MEAIIETTTPETTTPETIISRFLVSSEYGGFGIEVDALRMHYGRDCHTSYVGLNDPIRTDPKFIDVIKHFGILNTFGRSSERTIYSYPVNMIEFYTTSSPNIIPFELWFQPIITEYDGIERLREIKMLSPQMELMQKIRENSEGLSNEEKCRKYEEILSLQSPKIMSRRVEFQDVFKWAPDPRNGIVNNQ
jgi:hypothetical protein